MTDSTILTDVGPFTRDEVEILSTRKVEPEWLREQRMKAHAAFAEAPMPSTREEEWRYTDIAARLDLDALSLAEEAKPAASVSALPQGLRSLVEAAGTSSARLAQVDSSVVLRELPGELSSQGVLLMGLDEAVREHPELVEKHLGTAVTAEAGKFAAMNAALWAGGTFLYVPEKVRVEIPVRSFRWITRGGSAVFGRTL
ncbi:MAG TPA: hypothetical protein VFI96_06660, partial [Longimicrobiaceae bacterium]|nr:hypothetical protein [Longimicrobiaceae bacterium]